MRVRAAVLAVAIAAGVAGCTGPSPRVVNVAATTSPDSTPTVAPAQLGDPAALGPLADPGPAGTPSADNLPIPNAEPLGAPGFVRPGGIVNGITCREGEKFVFHVHAHLALFVDGKPRQVPAGIGVAPPLTFEPRPNNQSYVTNGACFGWLHTHTPDGGIHIEAPFQRAFVLGDLFDVWGQPLGRDRLGTHRGKVTAFYGGRPYLGDPRAIPLGWHSEIQLSIGDPVPAPRPVTWDRL
ncbi:MAG: hypothetical protein ACT4QF_07650 [Sporichthyaceae bacterium]